MNMFYIPQHKVCPHLASRHIPYNRVYSMKTTFYNFSAKIFRSTRWIALALISLLFCFSAVVPIAYAQDIVVTPAVIDGKGKQREILRYTVTIENASERLITIYPWVTDFGVSGVRGTRDLGGTEGKETHESLTRWVEVTRSMIDILPGDKREVPVLVQINLNAKPGMYHAVVHFSEGPDRVSAEANKNATHEVMLNIEVLDDAKEHLQLGTFVPDKNIFSGESASFNYRIENTGNRGVVPRGTIRIFDKKGEEIASVPANEDGEKIEPSGNAQLASVWAAQGEFGKYKAILDLEYGDRGVIQDTVYFWVLPWGKLLSYFLSLSVLMVMLALLFHSYSTSGRKMVYVTDVEPAQDEEIYEPTDILTLRDRLRGHFPRITFPYMRKSGAEIEDVATSSINAFTEVRIPAKMTYAPPRMRTESLSMVARSPASTPVRESIPSKSQITPKRMPAPTTLVAKVKKPIDPAHVVDLKRK